MRLIYTIGKGDPAGKPNVFSVPVAGGTPMALTTNAYAFPIEFPARGGPLPHVRHVEGGFNLWTMHADGSNPTALTHSSKWASQANWSPDGR